MPRAASPDWQPLLPHGVKEESAYVDVRGGAMCLNWHRPTATPRARILMCGPFGLERTFAYTTWKRLARAFAAAGFETVTFDYLGTGESSGVHHNVTGATCIADVAAVATLLSDPAAASASAGDAAAPASVPLVLAGLRAGGLFAADAFADGVANALLMLDPSTSMRGHLRDVLRRKLAEDFADKGKTGPKRTRDQYVAELLEIGTLEVEGLQWSRALYDESQALELRVPSEVEERPVHVVHLDRRPVSRHLIPNHTSVLPIPRPPFWGSDPLMRPNLDPIFDACVGFVADVVKASTHVDATPSSVRAAPPPGPTAKATTTTAREIIRLGVGHSFLVGTLHLPPDHLPPDHLPPDHLPPDHLPPEATPASGVLLLNAGQIPREGHGRLSVELGDALAERGHTVVRLDLSGLGDSPGELPSRCDTLWRFVEDGGQVAGTLEALEALKERFGIQRWAVGGLCGAAVNAVFCAAQRPDLVSGLLLLEPELFLLEIAGSAPEDVLPEAEVSATARGVATVRKVVRKVRSTNSWLRLVTGDSRLGPRLKVFGKVLLPLLLSKAPVPDDLNRPLAIALAKTIADRIPTLCITARGQLRELYLDKALRAFAPGPRPDFDWIRLDDTNHVFTSGGAKKTVGIHVVRWLAGQTKTAPRPAHHGRRRTTFERGTETPAPEMDLIPTQERSH